MNSEANARRITMVESCFGSSGQVSQIPTTECLKELHFVNNISQYICLVIIFY